MTLDVVEHLRLSVAPSRSTSGSASSHPAYSAWGLRRVATAACPCCGRLAWRVDRGGRRGCATGCRPDAGDSGPGARPRSARPCGLRPLRRTSQGGAAGCIPSRDDIKGAHTTAAASRNERPRIPRTRRGTSCRRYGRGWRRVALSELAGGDHGSLKFGRASSVCNIIHTSGIGRQLS
jgi:hypothetical protein